MTQEEKELLLKDLCARLPYNVVIRCTDNDTDYKCFLTTDILNELLHNIEYYDYKPYLRPLSSMTEEEEREYNRALIPLGDFMFEQEEEFKPIQLYENIPFELYEFFNSHHFDYHGLIPMGLALEAKEGMYITE